MENSYIFVYKFFTFSLIERYSYQHGLLSRHLSNSHNVIFPKTMYIIGQIGLKS